MPWTGKAVRYVLINVDAFAKSFLIVGIFKHSMCKNHTQIIVVMETSLSIKSC